jgi:Protein of unknown function (DUF4058)
MPSPFPGMDPYLEHPRWFHGFHNSLIIHLQEQLQPRLPAAYYAQTGQRIWVERLRRSVEPDVNVMRESEPAGRSPERGGVAVAEPVVRNETEAGQAVLISVEDRAPWEHTEWFLEIRELPSGQHRLVATIEVVSPANKTPSHQAFDKYRKKQRAVLAGQAHLVEIDLLRKGTHVTAVPRGVARAKAGPFDYHASVHRFDRPNDFFVYPIRLEERLPVLAIPLLPGDPDVLLDLQAAFDGAYDAGPFRKRIRYGEDTIKPPLRPEQVQWVQSILKPKAEPEGGRRRDD